MLALLVASGLAACSSNASSSLPGLDARPASQAVRTAGSPLSAGDFTAVSAFKMREGDDGRIVAMYPTYATWNRLGAVRPDGTVDDNLAYNGGAVQVHPTVYLVFWGSQWTAPGGDPSGVRPLLQRFVRAAGSGAWNGAVSQYYQIAGGRRESAGKPASLPSGIWIDPGGPPAVVSPAQLRAEAGRAARHFGDLSAGAGYVIALPHGVSTPGFGSMFCAYHDFTGDVSYTSLPYVPDAGAACGAGAVNTPGTADGVTIVASHELAETETDPQPFGGWYGPLGEIADPCAWNGLANNPEAGGFPTQPLWSNVDLRCTQG